MIHQADNGDSQLPQFTFLHRGHVTGFSVMTFYCTPYTVRGQNSRFLIIRLRSMIHQAQNCDSKLAQFPFFTIFRLRSCNGFFSYVFLLDHLRSLRSKQ